MNITRFTNMQARHSIYSRNFGGNMTYVVTENCINCKHTTCVEVCPTDAFREGPNFVVIEPDDCIDCNLCPAECPADAIFYEDDLLPEQSKFLELNRELALQWPAITETKEPMEDHESWDGKPDKIKLLEV